jgi:hypothetical protein
MRCLWRRSVAKSLTTSRAAERIPATTRQAALNAKLARQRAMDRALVRNFKQARPLLVAERAHELHIALDLVDRTLFRLAFLAVDGIDRRMPKPNGHGLKRPAFASSEQRHGHRGAGSERREKKIVRIGSCIGASGRERLVAHEPMSSDCDLLCVSGCAAVDRDRLRFRIVDQRATLLVRCGSGLRCLASLLVVAVAGATQFLPFPDPVSFTPTYATPVKFPCAKVNARLSEPSSLAE